MDKREFSLSTPAPLATPLAAPAPLPQAAPAHGAHGGEDPFASPHSGPLAKLRKRLGSIVAAIVALFAKFWAVIKGGLILLPKLKLLTTGATALVSVAAYSLFWGWTFALGFVILLFVHEMGHVIQLRREGVKASAPMFIPFMGAVVMMKSLPDDALAEARVGLAGPVLGTAGSAVCLGIAEVTNSDFFRALAYVGFFLNLFNLLPVVPLDGGRAMAAMAPWMWFVGLGAVVAMLLIVPNFILLIIAFFAGMEVYRRWQTRKTRTIEQAAYYRVSPRNRALVGVVYIGLIAILAFGMHEAHILTTAGHSFRSI